MPFADVLELFIPPLNALGVRYAVTGGVATIMYSAPRLTNDIDVLVELPPASVGALLRAFAPGEFFVPPTEAAVEEVRRSRGGHFQVIHVPSAQKADFYAAGEDPLIASALDDRRRREVAGREVWLAPPECVVVSKLEWYRAGQSDRHLRDVRAILEYAGPELDTGALERMVASRGLEAELAKARKAT